MTKKLYSILAVVLLASLVLTACGTPAATTAAPQPTTPPAQPTTPPAQPTTPPAQPTAVPTVAPTAAPKALIGEVTDLGGIDDKSFNASGWLGLEQAGKDFGVDAKYLESKQQSDYAKNIQEFISQKASLVITVGFLLGVDTAVAAKANPDTKFAIVDYAYPDCFGTQVEGKDCGSATVMDNVSGLTFQTDQAAFLAGYLAAGMTKTGKVASFGGLQIPTVTIFMKGFQAGVKYYNQKNGTKVVALGWDEKAQTGVFVGNFDSTDDGHKTAQSLQQEGADIIMPVAGPVGLGSAAYCMESKTCTIIGVDQDWFDSAPEYKSVVLSSVLKKINVAVYNTAKAVLDGTFKGGTTNFTIKDGGVDLAPYHDFDSQVPAALKTAIEQAKADLISGAITVDGVLGGS